MAETAPTITPERWNQALNLLHSLNEQLIASSGSKVRELERAVADQHDAILEMPAPHLRGVLAKMRLLFDLDLMKPDQDGYIKRQLVGDLATLIGVEA